MIQTVAEKIKHTHLLALLLLRGLLLDDGCRHKGRSAKEEGLLDLGGSGDYGSRRSGGRASTDRERRLGLPEQLQLHDERRHKDIENRKSSNKLTLLAGVVLAFVTKDRV